MNPRICAVMAAWILFATTPAWADAAEEEKAADTPSAAAAPAAEPATPPAEASAGEPAPVDDDDADLDEEVEEEEGEVEGGEKRFEDLSFREKYFSFSLPESVSPQIRDEQMKYILISILASYMLPFPEVWLPLVMWDPKPEFDFNRILVPWIIKTAIWIGGHVAMSACFVVPYLGWACGVVLIPLQFIWYGVNLWTERIMFLMIYDDILKHPPEKKKKEAAAAPGRASLVAAPVDEVEDISGR